MLYYLCSVYAQMSLDNLLQYANKEWLPDTDEVSMINWPNISTYLLHEYEVIQSNHAYMYLIPNKKDTARGWAHINPTRPTLSPKSQSTVIISFSVCRTLTQSRSSLSTNNFSQCFISLLIKKMQYFRIKKIKPNSRRHKLALFLTLST